MNEPLFRIPTREHIKELGLTPKRTEVFLRRMETARGLKPGQWILFEYRGAISLGKIEQVIGTAEEPQFLLSEVEGLAMQKTLFIHWYHVSVPFFPKRSENFKIGQLVWWNNGYGIQEGRITEVIWDSDRNHRCSFQVSPSNGKGELMIPDYRILGHAFELAKRFDPFLGKDK